MASGRPDLYDLVAERFAPAYDLSELVTSRNQERMERPFDARAVRERWERHFDEERQRAASPDPVHVYLHVPFCRERCSYCCYYSVAGAKHPELEAYVESLLRALDFFAPPFARRPLQTLYLGGGTPSLLDLPQIEKLLGGLLARYAFDADGEKTVECNPVSASRDKIEAFRRLGLNRISMGVQSLAAEPLARENRGYQGPDVVERAVRNVQEVGGFKLNLDLLVGMRGDTREIFVETFQAVVGRLRPEQITVYTIYPTRAYTQAHYGGDGQRFAADVEARYGDLDREAVAIAESAGYAAVGTPRLLDHAWEFRRQDYAGRFATHYDDLADTPMSLFGLGPTSRSRISGHLYYREDKARRAAFDPRAPVYRGLELCRADEMRKYVLMGLRKERRISKSRFRAAFGCEVGATFRPALAALASADLLREEGDDLCAAALDDATLFRSGLRFLDRARLREMAAADGGSFEAVLGTAKGDWRLSVEPAVSGARYLARARGLGLRVATANLRWPPAVRDSITKVVTDLFHASATAEPSTDAARVARTYFAELSRCARKLPGGFLRAG